MSLGMNMQQLRIKRGWSQREVAEKLRYQPSTYSRYESDDTIPNLITLMSIANLFGVGLDELTGFVPEMEGNPSKLKSSLRRLEDMGVVNKVEGDAIYIEVYGKNYAVNLSDLSEVVRRTDIQYDKMLMDFKGLYNASLAVVLSGGGFDYAPFSLKLSELSDKLRKHMNSFKGKITPDDVIDWFRDEFLTINQEDRKKLWNMIVERLLYRKKLKLEDYEKDERWQCPFAEVYQEKDDEGK